MRNVILSIVLLAAGCAPPPGNVDETSEGITSLTGVDYSFARPSPSSLYSGGYRFVARYYSYDNSGTHGKILFNGEAQSLINAGLDIVSNWEYAADDSLNGYNAGVADAKEANAQAAAAGAPADRPIYFSVDFDATPAQQTPINAYFDGVASVIGLNRTGAYGGYYVIKRLFDANKIKWGWQTYAWSGGQWDSRAQLRQVLNGISAGGSSNCCDKDTSQADDFGQWGHAKPWGAQYVSQSWPLASSSMKMIAGQTVAASITLRNDGSKTWDSNTKLGTTQPRDRASAFADSSWLSPSRADHVTGTVGPNGTFKFQFNFHAPAKAGTYHEFFNLVQEGVAWFSDPGQGGPADDNIEAWIEVVLPNYSGQFSAQSFPAATKAPVMIGTGQSVMGWIDVKNTGAQPWKAGVTKLAPTPRDKPSPLDGAGWLSPTRVSTVAADVAPGAVGHFLVELNGNAVGDYTQTFALVEEGVTWFSDAANGGGPPDDFMKVHVIVTDQPQEPPAGDDAGAVADLGTDPGTPGDNGNGDTGGVGSGGDGTMPTQPASGCSFGGAAQTGAPALLLLALALLPLVRRRSRT
jgi:hypothetical protein